MIPAAQIIQIGIPLALSALQFFSNKRNAAAAAEIAVHGAETAAEALTHADQVRDTATAAIADMQATLQNEAAANRKRTKRTMILGGGAVGTAGFGLGALCEVILPILSQSCGGGG